MADSTEIAAAVLAYVTAAIHDDRDALVVADEALRAYPVGSVFALFTALVVVAGAADTMDLEQLKGLLGDIGLGYQRHLSATEAPPPK